MKTPHYITTGLQACQKFPPCRQENTHDLKSIPRVSEGRVNSNRSFEGVQFDFGSDSAKDSLRKSLGLTRDMRSSLQVSGGASKSTGQSLKTKKMNLGRCETTENNLKGQIGKILGKTLSTSISGDSPNNESLFLAKQQIEQVQRLGRTKIRERSSFGQTHSPTDTASDSIELGKVKSIIGNMESTLENLKSWVKHQETRESTGPNEAPGRGIMEIIRECNKNEQKNLRDSRILKQRKNSVESLIAKSRHPVSSITPQNQQQKGSIANLSQQKFDVDSLKTDSGNLIYTRTKQSSITAQNKKVAHAASRSTEKSSGSQIGINRSTFINPGKTPRNVYIKNLVERQKINAKLRKDVSNQRQTLAQSKSANSLKLNHSASQKTTKSSFPGQQILFGKKYSFQDTNGSNQKTGNNEAFVILTNKAEPSRFQKISDLDYQQISEHNAELSNAKKSLKKLVIQTHRIDAISKDFVANMFKDVLPQCSKIATSASLRSNSRSREKTIKFQAEKSFMLPAKKSTDKSTENITSAKNPISMGKQEYLQNVSKFELPPKKPPKPQKLKFRQCDEAKLSPSEEKSFKKTVKLEFSTILNQCDVGELEIGQYLQNISTENQKTKNNEITPIITTISLDYTRSKETKNQQEGPNPVIIQPLENEVGEKRFLKSNSRLSENAARQKSVIRSFEAD